MVKLCRPRAVFWMLIAAGVLVFQAGGSAAEPIHSVEFYLADGNVRTIQGTKAEILKLAENFIQKGDYQYAKTCYERLIDLDSRDIRNYILLGQLYEVRFRNFANALKYYKRAESMVPPSNPG